MYYFLGLVTSKNLVRGNIVPDYFLSSFATTNANYAPFRIVRRGRGRETMPRVLVTALSGRENDMMIDFMSNYRTRINHHSYKKFYPKGALFWFECDKKGNSNGTAVFIKRVPVSKGRLNDDKWKRMSEELLRTFTLTELFTRHVDSLQLETAKPLLVQITRPCRESDEEIAAFAKRKRKSFINYGGSYAENKGSKAGRTGRRAAGEDTGEGDEYDGDRNSKEHL